jgi:hypothetical protein
MVMRPGTLVLAVAMSPDGVHWPPSPAGRWRLVKSRRLKCTPRTVGSEDPFPTRFGAFGGGEGLGPLIIFLPDSSGWR